MPLPETSGVSVIRQLPFGASLLAVQAAGAASPMEIVSPPLTLHD